MLFIIFFLYFSVYFCVLFFLPFIYFLNFFSNSETSHQSVLQQGEDNPQASSLQTQTSHLAVAKNSATSSKRVMRQSPNMQSAGGRTQSSHQG